MKYILAISMVFLLLLPATTPVFAQGAGIEWDILNQEVMDKPGQNMVDISAEINRL